MQAALKMGVKVDLTDPKNKALMRVGAYLDAYAEHFSELREWEVQVIEDENLTAAEKKLKRREIASPPCALDSVWPPSGAQGGVFPFPAHVPPGNRVSRARVTEG